MYCITSVETGVLHLYICTK